MEPEVLGNAVSPRPDYWRCRTCGCVWRDNHDGTLSLGSAKQTSCVTCEAMTDATTCDPLYKADQLTLLSSSTEKIAQLPRFYGDLIPREEVLKILRPHGAQEPNREAARAASPRPEIGQRAAWRNARGLFHGQIIDIRNGLAYVACVGWPLMEQVPVDEYLEQRDGIWRGCPHDHINAAGLCIACQARLLAAISSDSEAERGEK